MVISQYRQIYTNGLCPYFDWAEEAALTLKAGATIGEVLSEYTGKRVVLRLASGDEIEGTVTIVGNSLLHLAKLSGKELYDAVVSIGKISAVRMRVRENEGEIEGAKRNRLAY